MDCRPGHGIAWIDPEKCVGCGACRAHCPAHAIRMLPGWKSEVVPERCVGCGTCVAICHKHAAQLVADCVLAGR